MTMARFPLMSELDHTCAMTFVEVGDIRIHYERRGRGAPCVLLHGGFASHRSWDLVSERLRPELDVIAIDSRGQGRSFDGRGPITYGRMAEDVVRVMDALDVERFHVVGHSDGGCTALHLLVDYPDRISSATLLGTPRRLSDYRAGTHALLVGVLDAMALTTEDLGLGFADHYRLLSPHPDRWKLLVQKLGATWRTQPVFSDEMLSLVDVPVLVIGVGHDEFLERDVFAQTARVFPRGEISWIEEATHAVPISHPERVAEAVAEFVGKLS